MCTYIRPASTRQASSYRGPLFFRCPTSTHFSRPNTHSSFPVTRINKVDLSPKKMPKLRSEIPDRQAGPSAICSPPRPKMFHHDRGVCTNKNKCYNQSTKRVTRSVSKNKKTTSPSIRASIDLPKSHHAQNPITPRPPVPVLLATQTPPKIMKANVQTMTSSDQNRHRFIPSPFKAGVRSYASSKTDNPPPPVSPPPLPSLPSRRFPPRKKPTPPLPNSGT